MGPTINHHLHLNDGLRRLNGRGQQEALDFPDKPLLKRTALPCRRLLPDAGHRIPSHAQDGLTTVYEKRPQRIVQGKQEQQNSLELSNVGSRKKRANGCRVRDLLVSEQFVSKVAVVRLIRSAVLAHKRSKVAKGAGLKCAQIRIPK